MTEKLEQLLEIGRPLFRVELCMTETKDQSSIQIDILPRADAILDRFRSALRQMAAVGDGLPDIDKRFISSATERGKLSIASIFAPVQEEVVGKLAGAFALAAAKVELVKSRFSHFARYMATPAVSFDAALAGEERSGGVNDVLAIVSGYEDDIAEIESLPSSYVCGVLVIDASKVKDEMTSTVQSARHKG